MQRHVQIRQVRRLDYSLRLQTKVTSLTESISSFPALIEVTLEELETGLESGHFTSVDLVNVGSSFPVLYCTLLNMVRPILQGFLKLIVLLIASQRSTQMLPALQLNWTQNEPVASQGVHYMESPSSSRTI